LCQGSEQPDPPRSKRAQVFRCVVGSLEKPVGGRVHQETSICHHGSDSRREGRYVAAHRGRPARSFAFALGSSTEWVAKSWLPATRSRSDASAPSFPHHRAVRRALIPPRALTSAGRRGTPASGAPTGVCRERWLSEERLRCRARRLLASPELGGGGRRPVGRSSRPRSAWDAGERRPYRGVPRAVVVREALAL